MRVAASTCTTHWNGLWGIPGSDEETQHPQWGGCEAGMGQRRVFRGGCEWVSPWLGQSERKGQTGGSSALSSCEKVLVLWVFQGLGVTSLCRFIMGSCVHRWDVVHESRGELHVPRAFSQEQEGRAGGRQPKPLLFGSLLLSQVPLPKMRSEKKWEFLCSATPQAKQQQL